MTIKIIIKINNLNRFLNFTYSEKKELKLKIYWRNEYYSDLFEEKEMKWLIWNVEILELEFNEDIREYGIEKKSQMILKVAMF